MTLSLSMLAVPPALTIIFDERIGYKHRAAALESLARSQTAGHPTD